MSNKPSVFRSSLMALDKPRGAFHPVEVESDFPKHHFWPKSLGDQDAYDGLTDDSLFSEYAWEFLRRNRFFQQVQDRVNAGDKPKYTEEQWAFQSHPLIEANTGLGKKLAYETKYVHSTDGIVQFDNWNVIRDFHDRLNRHRAGQLERLDFPQTQVQIIFDIDPQFNGVPPIEIQIEMAREALWNRATTLGYVSNEGPKTKRPTKKGLRNLLRIIDLFSEKNDHSLPTVSRLFNKYEAQQAPRAETNKRPIDEMTRSEIADQKEIEDAERKKRETRTSELATEAFKYVYQGKYLGLLAFTD
jgi:hypothetical protein